MTHLELYKLCMFMSKQSVWRLFLCFMNQSFENKDVILSLSLLTGQWAAAELQTDSEQVREGANAKRFPASLSADQPPHGPAARLLTVPARWVQTVPKMQKNWTLHLLSLLYSKLITFCPHPVRFYEGVVELCLTAADKKDPQKLGLHFYRNGEPEEDASGQQAFQERSVHTYIRSIRSWGALVGVTGSNRAVNMAFVQALLL